MNLDNPDLVQELTNRPPRLRTKEQVEATAIYMKEWRRTHQASVKVSNAARDPERLRQLSRDYGQLHPEKHSLDNAAWAVKNREKAGATSMRKVYGPKSPEHKAQQLEEQKGCCAICSKQVIRQKRRPALDHNHKTGQLRGVLCAQCNHALERLESQSDWDRRAQEYLAKWQSQPEQDQLFIPPESQVRLDKAKIYNYFQAKV